MAQVDPNYPRHLEVSLARALTGRFKLADQLIRDLIARGERPADAVEQAEVALAEMPWDEEGLVALGERCDKWAARRTTLAARKRIREPQVQAAVLTRADARPDPSGPVTLYGTTFRNPSDEPTHLVDLAKLEERWKADPSYVPPGQHGKAALRFGDQLDVNRPVNMPRVKPGELFRDPHKLAALRDRGYKVAPVAGDPGPGLRPDVGKQLAVAEGAGRNMVDARSWAEGIIGRGNAVQRDYFANVKEAVTTAWREGRSQRQLVGELRRSFKLADARARFIARDRLGSLNAAATRDKHISLGFTHYRWLSSDDERVRPLHRAPGSPGAARGALHGTIRAWDDPHPTEGHPGDAPNCRCVAIPVTVDDARRERKRGRAVATAAAVGVAAVAVGVAARRRAIRPEAVPFRRRPAEPLVRVPAPTVKRMSEAEMQGVLSFPTGGRAVLRANNRARFRYAHELTKRIQAAERQRGVTHPPGWYRATWAAAERAIRDAADDTSLRIRLSEIAARGTGPPIKIPSRQPRYYKTRARGKPRKLKRNVGRKARGKRR